MAQLTIHTLAARVAADIPGTFSHKSLIGLRGFTSAVRGGYLNPSANQSSFYVESFICPLYVPATTVYFNIGNRVPFARDPLRFMWSLDEGSFQSLSGAMRREVLPLLGIEEDFSAVVRLAGTLANSADPWVRLGVACSYMRMDRFSDGVSELRTLRSDMNNNIAWQQQIIAYIDAVMIHYGQSLADLEQFFTRCEMETCAALGLSNYRIPPPRV